jgi:hypothetical protein
MVVVKRRRTTTTRRRRATGTVASPQALASSNWASRKLWVAVGVLVAAVLLGLLGVLDKAQVADVLKWVAGTYIGFQAVQNGVESTLAPPGEVCETEGGE